MNTENIDLRASLRRRLADLLIATADTTRPDAHARYLALRDDTEEFARPMRRALLVTPLAWNDEERREAAWLQQTCDDLAILGHRLAVRAAPRLGISGSDALDVFAAALYYMGETLKWGVAISPEAPHDMRKVHGLLMFARAQGRHRAPLILRVEGRDRECTIESLYFRVLLLARHASGELNPKQMEILDAWMWLWVPVLSGVEEVPAGTALRADLDSALGLQQGARVDAGPSLYLPGEPIEAVYREVVAHFHAGRIVPSEGLASEFRIEEHVAVLGLVRRNLHSKRASASRAERRRVDRPVELFVGLAEIAKRGFAPAAPAAAPVTLAAIEARLPAGELRIERDYDTAVAEIYEPERRYVRVLDESDTGLGMEGESADLAGVAAGELVALRRAPGDPLTFGKVVRSVASKTAGRTVIGVRRISGAARLVDLDRDPASHPAQAARLVFVAGADSSGRQDGMLVSERDFNDRAPMAIATEDKQYRLRLNRARERGRGWVLAGFEVASARPACEIELA